MGANGPHVEFMRGEIEQQHDLVVTITPEELVAGDHPIRGVKKIADEVLREMKGRLDGLYAEKGRPSIPPQMLLKAQVLIALYSVLSERLFCERLRYDFLFRWFLVLPGAGTAFNATTFSKNRQRLLEAEIFEEFFGEVVEQARKRFLLSYDHFTVDGTLIEANASLKSFRSKKGGGEPPKPGGGRNTEVNFRGEKRHNDTHVSTTDPDAKLYRKGEGQPSQLCYLGHVLMENRHGLCVGTRVTTADGWGERVAALELLDGLGAGHRITLATDKGYDTRDFVTDLRQRGVTPHVAQHTTKRRSAIDGRTTRHAGYGISQSVRKRVEEIFGWAKTIGGLAKTRFRGLARLAAQVLVVMSAYNLVRIARLEAARA
jgi:transposase